MKWLGERKYSSEGCERFINMPPCYSLVRLSPENRLDATPPRRSRTDVRHRKVQERHVETNIGVDRYCLCSWQRHWTRHVGRWDARRGLCLSASTCQVSPPPASTITWGTDVGLGDLECACDLMQVWLAGKEYSLSAYLSTRHLLAKCYFAIASQYSVTRWRSAALTCLGSPTFSCQAEQFRLMRSIQEIKGYSPAPWSKMTRNNRLPNKKPEYPCSKHPNRTLVSNHDQSACVPHGEKPTLLPHLPHLPHLRHYPSSTVTSL